MDAAVEPRYDVVFIEWDTLSHVTSFSQRVHEIME